MQLSLSLWAIKPLLVIFPWDKKSALEKQHQENVKIRLI